MVYGSGNFFPPSVGSFPLPVVPPDIDPDGGEQVTVCFSVDWLPSVIGALQQLALQATWEGDDAAVLLAQSRAQTLIAMFGQDDGGCENTVCLSDVIYDSGTDAIERSIDGGMTYFPLPEGDPRHGAAYRYPPITATDVRCQAASNMTRFISDLVAQVLLVVDEAGAFEGLTAIILPFILELGPFGILIDLVLALGFILFSAGAAAIAAAFTSGVYDTLTCIFDCALSADGTCTADQLAAINTQIDAQIGGLAATVLHALLLLTGEVGLSNMAQRANDPSPNCSGCACDWCYHFDFSVDDGGFAVYSGGGGGGTWDGSGWAGTTVGTERQADISRTFSARAIDEISVKWDTNANDGNRPTLILYLSGTQVFRADAVYSTGSSQIGATFTANPSAVTADEYRIFMATTFPAIYFCEILDATIKGQGSNPIASNNC